LAGAGGTGAAGAEAEPEEADPPLGAAATTVGAEAEATGAAAGAGAADEVETLGAVGAEEREAPKLELEPLEAAAGEPPPKVGRAITPPVPGKADVGAGTGGAGAEKAGAGSEGPATVPLKSCRALSGRRGATGASGKFGATGSKDASREAPTTGLSEPGFFESRDLA